MVLAGGVARDVQIADLGVDGASLVSARPISQGSVIQLRFEVPIAGIATALIIKARVVYSSYVGPAQFRVGVVFQDLDVTNAAAIAGVSA